MEVALNMNGYTEEFMQALESFMKNYISEKQARRSSAHNLHLLNAKSTIMKKTYTLSPSVNNKIESIFNSSDLSLHELKKPAKTEEGILGFHYTGPKPEQEREYLNKIGYGSGSSPESDTTLLAFSSEWMKEDESFCMGLQKYPSLEIDWDAIDKLSGSV
ncbi:hypothetical protein Bca52824_055774 [Brassica carinata]|uniref:Uncharacterized protein n=1 Tax=Brassica carinata TaxID=52824 RepID=A0A8X7R8K8_BRACI|nr:hypothetical protein Bca52824_055774 [Brassica carinata]